jgi:hypothetical protein
MNAKAIPCEMYLRTTVTHKTANRSNTMQLKDPLPSYAQSVGYVATESTASDHQKHLDLADGHLHGPCN